MNSTTLLQSAEIEIESCLKCESLYITDSANARVWKKRNNPELSHCHVLRAFRCYQNNWHFSLLINSTSNALYINKLKMTEVSVETCLINLKVLSFSLKF